MLADNPWKEHIVPFIDFSAETKSLLEMEYLPLGNLGDQHADSPITVEETTTLLYQCLRGLEYLHAHNVAHRDINRPIYSCVPGSLSSSNLPFCKPSVGHLDMRLRDIPESDLFKICGLLVFGGGCDGVRLRTASSERAPQGKS